MKLPATEFASLTLLDEKTFVLANFDGIARRKLQSGNSVRELHGGIYGGVLSFATSLDRRRLAAALYDGTIHVWATDTLLFDEEFVFRVGPAVGGGAVSIRFTPDGRHIVAVNGNGTIYVIRLEEWSP